MKPEVEPLEALGDISSGEFNMDQYGNEGITDMGRYLGEVKCTVGPRWLRRFLSQARLLNENNSIVQDSGPPCVLLRTCGRLLLVGVSGGVGPAA